MLLIGPSTWFAITLRCRILRLLLFSAPPSSAQAAPPPLLLLLLLLPKASASLAACSRCTKLARTAPARAADTTR
jgi:hypothetical protein